MGFPCHRHVHNGGVGHLLRHVWAVDGDVEWFQRWNQKVSAERLWVFNKATAWPFPKSTLPLALALSPFLAVAWYVQNVSTFLNTFAIVSPLICVFWMQLTRTNAVFSRIALVSRFCAEIQILVKIRKNIAKNLFHQKTHGARRRDGEGPGGHHTTRGRGPGLVAHTCCVTASVVASTPDTSPTYL
jgi:hypothetical protein